MCSSRPPEGTDHSPSARTPLDAADTAPPGAPHHRRPRGRCPAAFGTERRGDHKQPVIGAHDLWRDVLEVQEPSKLVQLTIALKIRARLRLLEDRRVDPKGRVLKEIEHLISNRLRVFRGVEARIEMEPLPPQGSTKLEQVISDGAVVGSNGAKDEIPRSTLAPREIEVARFIREHIPFGHSLRLRPDRTPSHKTRGKSPLSSTFVSRSVAVELLSATSPPHVPPSTRSENDRQAGCRDR